MGIFEHEEIKRVNQDYRERINHLANAITALAGAISYLGQRVEDPGELGIAEVIKEKVDAARGSVNTACWEL